MPRARVGIVPTTCPLVPISAQLGPTAHAARFLHTNNENAPRRRSRGGASNLLVEMAGIEPASDNQRRGILRVHSANYFSAFGYMQTCYRIGSVN